MAINLPRIIVLTLLIYSYSYSMERARPELPLEMHQHLALCIAAVSSKEDFAKNVKAYLLTHKNASVFLYDKIFNERLINFYIEKFEDPSACSVREYYDNYCIPAAKAEIALKLGTVAARNWLKENNSVFVSAAVKGALATAIQKRDYYKVMCLLPLLDSRAISAAGGVGSCTYPLVTLLHHAVTDNPEPDLALVKLLLKAGAQINTCVPGPLVQDADGMFWPSPAFGPTPLEVAIDTVVQIAKCKGASQIDCILIKMLLEKSSTDVNFLRRALDKARSLIDLCEQSRISNVYTLIGMLEDKIKALGTESLSLTTKQC